MKAAALCENRSCPIMRLKISKRLLIRRSFLFCIKNRRPTGLQSDAYFTFSDKVQRRKPNERTMTGSFALPWQIEKNEMMRTTNRIT